MTMLLVRISEILNIVFKEAAASAGLSRDQVIKAMIQAYTKGRINIVDAETGELKRQVDMRLNGGKPAKPGAKVRAGNTTRLTEGGE